MPIYKRLHTLCNKLMHCMCITLFSVITQVSDPKNPFILLLLLIFFFFFFFFTLFFLLFFFFGGGGRDNNVWPKTTNILYMCVKECGGGVLIYEYCNI